MLTLLLQGLTLGIAAAATPGVFQIFCISQTVQKGWRRALPVAFAPLVSDAPIIALVLLVLTTLPPLVLTIMQIIGGLFLLYLAWGAWRAAATPRQSATDPSAPSGSLLQACLINLLNPNPYIFWSTVGGTILLTAWRTSPVHAAAFLLGMYVMLCGGFVVLILSTGWLQARGRTAAFNPLPGRLAAIGLGLFGIYQIVTGIIAL